MVGLCASAAGLVLLLSTLLVTGFDTLLDFKSTDWLENMSIEFTFVFFLLR